MIQISDNTQQIQPSKIRKMFNKALEYDHVISFTLGCLLYTSRLFDDALLAYLHIHKAHRHTDDERGGGFSLSHQLL